MTRTTGVRRHAPRQVFKDRREAGQVLAGLLQSYRGRPDVIVLGGGLSRMAHLYTQVPTLWGQWVFSAGAQADVRTRLVAAQHGDASGVRGAAWLWQQPA
jgi:fructokinase